MKRILLISAVITIGIILYARAKMMSGGHDEDGLISGDGVVLRSSPIIADSTDKLKIRLSAGDKVEIIGRNNQLLTLEIESKKVTDDWTKIRVNGNVGWVYSYYVEGPNRSMSVENANTEGKFNRGSIHTYTNRELARSSTSNEFVGKEANLFYINSLDLRSCDIYAPCDCCSRRLRFIDENRFVLVSQCIDSYDYLTFGNYYEIANGTGVVLQQLSGAVTAGIDHSPTSSGKYEFQEYEHAESEVITFALSKCKDSGKWYLSNFDEIGLLRKYEYDDISRVIDSEIEAAFSKYSFYCPSMKSNYGVHYDYEYNGRFREFEPQSSFYRKSVDQICGNFVPGKEQEVISINRVSLNPKISNTIRIHQYINSTEHEERVSDSYAYATDVITLNGKGWFQLLGEMPITPTTSRSITLVNEGDLLFSDGIDEFLMIVINDQIPEIGECTFYSFDKSKNRFENILEFRTNLRFYDPTEVVYNPTQSVRAIEYVKCPNGDDCNPTYVKF